jgi:hypothetical protein
MDILDLVDLERVGLADGRKERLFGDSAKQPEHDVGGLDGIFALSSGVLEENLDLRPQAGHQLVDPLELGTGRAQEQAFPMSGVPRREASPRGASRRALSLSSGGGGGCVLSSKRPSGC